MMRQRDNVRSSGIQLVRRRRETSEMVGYLNKTTNHRFTIIPHFIKFAQFFGYNLQYFGEINQSRII